MPQSAIVGIIRALAATFPQRVAVASSGQTLTYAELERTGAAIAAGLALQPCGEIVGLLLPNTPDLIATFLGVLWAGKTVAILPSLAPPPLLKVMAAEAGFQTVVTSAELAGRLAGADVTPLSIEQLSSDTGREGPLANRAQEAAVLLYTSGTTGRPKAVALSEQNVLSNVEGCAQACRFGSEEVMLAMLPFFHAFGLTVTCLLPLTSGGSVVLLERFSPRRVLQAIEHRRVTYLVAVPSQYRLLVRESTSANTRSLRVCIAGAERLPDAVADDFEARFGLPLLQGYGATEASPVISVNTLQAHRRGSVGQPLPNVRVSIRRNGHEQGMGPLGEIFVEGPSVMLGYYNHPEATAEKLVDGALRTGDLGLLDAAGFLHLAGRSDDLIKMAGEKVHPAEIERVVEELEGVEEAVVIATPEEKHGMLLRAFLQLRPGAALTESSVRAACRDRLEAFKVPREFVVVDQIPRTPTGKIDRRALAALGKP